MESDRGAVLTIRAANRGIIDFSRAELLDPEWWRRYYILVNAMARDDDMALQRGAMDFHLALVANSGLTEESFKNSQTNAKDSYLTLVSTVRPWNKQDQASRQSAMIDNAYEEYKAAFGEDIRDPDFQERNKADLERWIAERDATLTPEDVEDIVTRKLVAREARIEEMRRRLSNPAVRR